MKVETIKMFTNKEAKIQACIINVETTHDLGFLYSDSILVRDVPGYSNREGTRSNIITFLCPKCNTEYKMTSKFNPRLGSLEITCVCGLSLNIWPQKNIGYY